MMSERAWFQCRFVLDKVCTVALAHSGNHYVHGQVAMVPILHVKNWQRMIKRDPYCSQMKNAVENISLILLGNEDTNGTPPGSTVFSRLQMHQDIRSQDCTF